MIYCVGSTGSKRSRVSVSSCFTFHSSAVSLLQKSREKESGMLEEAASDQTSEERKVERKVFVSLNSPSQFRPGNSNSSEGGGWGGAGLEDKGVTADLL